MFLLYHIACRLCSNVNSNNLLALFICHLYNQNSPIGKGGLLLHLSGSISGRWCNMSYYEFIFVLVLVTGYIISIKKK